ncbi:hypothetical protein MD484_g6651, partial [Candolleomyces efflorescens]
MTSTPSSMAVSTPSLSPSSPLSALNEHQSPLPLGSGREEVEGDGDADGDGDALLSPLSPGWGVDATDDDDTTAAVDTTLTNPTTTTTTAPRHGILGLPTHTLTSTLSPSPPPSPTLLSPSGLHTFEASMEPDDLWYDDFEDEPSPAFLLPYVYDTTDDDTNSLRSFANPPNASSSLSSSSSLSLSYTSRPILPLLDIPPPRSGTTTATRSRATSRSRSRSPFWDVPALPRSATPSVVGADVRDDEHDDTMGADRVFRADEDEDAEDGDGEEGQGEGEGDEFIVSPPSSGPPDTPSTPTDLPALPFLDLFDEADDDDEDGEEEVRIPRSPRTKPLRDTIEHEREHVVRLPGYFPHPTSPSISLHPLEEEGSSVRRTEDEWKWIHNSDSASDSDLHPPHLASPRLLSSLPTPFAPSSPSPSSSSSASGYTSPPILEHASPRPGLLQLTFDDQEEEEFGLVSLSSSPLASPPNTSSGDRNNSLRLLLHDSPPTTSVSAIKEDEGYTYAYPEEEVKKLVQLQERAREAERVAREREGAVGGALSARRGVVGVGLSTSSSLPFSFSSSTPFTIRNDENNKDDHGDVKEQEHENETKTTYDSTDILLLQRAAAEARSVAKRERERVKEVGALLRLKLGRRGASDSSLSSSDSGSDTDLDSDELDIDVDDTTTTVPTDFTSPSPPLLKKTKTRGKKEESIAQLVAKMFLSRREASSSTSPVFLSPAPPPSTPDSPTTLTPTSPSSAPPSSLSPSSTPTTPTPPSIPPQKHKSKPLWLKSGILGPDKFLRYQLQQRYTFLRSSPLGRNASFSLSLSSTSTGEGDVDDLGGEGDEKRVRTEEGRQRDGDGDREEEEEEEEEEEGGFEALRRPIMWGVEGEGLLPAL